MNKMRQSVNYNISNSIEGLLQNRFSTSNVLPKTQKNQLKSQDERNFSQNPHNEDLQKHNQIIRNNIKAIEQISKAQSIEDKKGILKDDQNQAQNNEQNKNLNPQSSAFSSQNYFSEEIQQFNATIPIRGSYKESNTSSLPLPPKQLNPLRDGQKKSQKRVTINAENMKIQHYPKEGETQQSTIKTLKDKNNSSEFEGILGNRNFQNSNEHTTEKQSRIDGQIKKYMHKIGLQKKDKFPVFYTLDENGDEVKTTLSNPQIYAKFTNSQQPYLLQKQANAKITSNHSNAANYLNETKSKKFLNRAIDSEDRLDQLPSQNENLEDIMKICQQFQKTIVGFDKKNYKSAKKNANDFRRLNSQLKQLDLQNLIIQESDDPALQPYYQNLKQSGRVREPKIKDLLETK